MKKIPLLLSLALVAGCAHPGGKALDEKVNKQTEVRNRSDLRQEADRLIESDPGLSADERKKLLDLRSSLTPRLDDISRHELRLRAVLMEELLSPTYSIDEVALIKKRLRKLEDERLSLTFDAVDQANKILGNDARSRLPMLRAMMEERARGNDAERE